MKNIRPRAPRNRTLHCPPAELAELEEELVHLSAPAPLATVRDRIINQDFFTAVRFLPKGCVDLLILDPPYNLSKNYNGQIFRERGADAYRAWFGGLIGCLTPMLAPAATIYVCADWRTSVLIQPLLEEAFVVRNRITWEREKGRGAKRNWKNNTEDIWFCTAGEDYYFDVDAVKLKRRVIAPYRDAGGRPKDWEEEENGNYRLTYPSNIWTDLTVPFWSMPENTDHPTQKPEKLIARLIMASSRKGDIVFDPFLGSGTTAVVAKKLQRHFIAVEENYEYCCWAQKRLQLAITNPTIQGYHGGVFWERNSCTNQMKSSLLAAS